MRCCADTRISPSAASALLASLRVFRQWLINIGLTAITKAASSREERPVAASVHRMIHPSRPSGSGFLRCAKATKEVSAAMQHPWPEIHDCHQRPMQFPMHMNSVCCACDSYPRNASPRNLAALIISQAKTSYFPRSMLRGWRNTWDLRSSRCVRAEGGGLQGGLQDRGGELGRARSTALKTKLGPQPSRLCTSCCSPPGHHPSRATCTTSFVSSRE